MAYTILSNCTACGLCLPACPIDAILVADPIYVIDQELCCDFEDCLAVCPVDAIVPSDSVLSLDVQASDAECLPPALAPKGRGSRCRRGRSSIPLSAPLLE